MTYAASMGSSMKAYCIEFHEKNFPLVLLIAFIFTHPIFIVA